MSIADIVAALYFHQMRIDSKKPSWEDRFVLSKGHSVLAQYVALAELGFFPKKELKTVKNSEASCNDHLQHGQRMRRFIRRKQCRFPPLRLIS